MAEPRIEQHLGNIQGNILAAFNKDFQTFLFFKIPDAASGRAWLAKTVEDIATTDNVLAFNLDFKRRKSRLGNRDPVLRAPFKATWVNIAFTHTGLAALGAQGLEELPDEFKDGMRKRAKILGDVDESAPERWIEPFRDQDIHGMLIVAADHDADCRWSVRRQTERLATFGLKLLRTERGQALLDAGRHTHEHFGFRDGISQPGILGVTPVSDPLHPDEGDPGQDLIQPGEFVLGYPSERPVAAVLAPAWAVDGSYLVFRRLRQDVQAFRDFIKKQAAAERISEDLMGAKLVGRYASGAPLEGANDQRRDPAKRHPSILEDARINDFKYGGDPDGYSVPRAAHIRKAYPRDEVPPGEDETRAHRLLRRGIAYGESFQERAPPGSPGAGDADRGLLFLSYQSSIAGQFEFVQRRMVNNPDFPRDGDGRDPIISQDASSRTFTLPGGVHDHVTLMQRWVITTGGDYFFSPSISALRELSAERS